MRRGLHLLAGHALGPMLLTFISCSDRPGSPLDHPAQDAGILSNDANPADSTLLPLYPQYRFDPGHQGISPPEASLRGGLALRWQTLPYGIGTYSASKSSPAVDEDRVFVGVDDGRLLALDRATGALLWEFKTRRFFTELATFGSQPLGIHGSPAFDHKHVYIGDYDGFLYAVDKSLGTLIWEQKLGDSIGASPTLHDGWVYIAVEFSTLDGQVFIVDAMTGNILWATPLLGAHPHSSVSLDTGRGLMFVGANNGVLFCFDYHRHTLQWTYQTGGEIKSTPAVGTDRVYITSWDKKLHAVSIEDGALRFTFTTSDVIMSSPSIAFGRVYFGSHDSLLYALDAITGKLAWTFNTHSPILSSPTLVTNRRLLVVGSQNPWVYLIDMDLGTLLQSIPLPGGLSSVPVVVGDALFLNDDTGTVTCFASPTPQN